MSLLNRWEPEDAPFWRTEGRSRAWLTLGVTTVSLIASFATWFVFSAVAVRLPVVVYRIKPPP